MESCRPCSGPLSAPAQRILSALRAQYRAGAARRQLCECHCPLWLPMAVMLSVRLSDHAGILPSYPTRTHYIQPMAAFLLS